MREPAAPLRETPPPSVRASWTDLLNTSALVRSLVVTIAAALFLVLVDAFSIGGSALTRLLFWVPAMLLAGAVATGVVYLLGQARGLRRNLWVFGAVSSLAITPPAALVIWAWWSLIFRHALDVGLLRDILPGVFVVSAAMTAIQILVNRAGPVTHAPPPGAAPKPVRFLDRLPPKLRGADLYAVEAEDHYLRLHTSKGSDLILLRLADAIAELDGLEGAQVHRSWWIAKDGFESVARDNGRVSLKLKSGVIAPVSRPNVRALRDAGWI